MTISGMPVIGRYTKLGHGHLLSVWKAAEGPDTLDISHDSGIHTERITHIHSTIFKIPKS